MVDSEQHKESRIKYDAEYYIDWLISLNSITDLEWQQKQISTFIMAERHHGDQISN